MIKLTIHDFFKWSFLLVVFFIVVLVLVILTSQIVQLSF
jgi:hypothetical protein